MNQDKLRVEQNLSQIAVQNGLNCEPVHLRGFRIGNTCYESSELGSQMLSFSSNPQSLLGHKDNVMIQESNNRVGEGSFGNFSCSSTDWISNPMIHPGYQESHSSFVGDISTQNSQKPCDNLHCYSSFDQHTLLQDVVGNELLLRPVYADQFRLKSGVRWDGELGFGEDKTVDRVDHTMTSNDNPSCQALALSLSSVPLPKVHVEHSVERDIPADMLSRFTHRNPVPLGPFTGYATILGSSKFLKPAQQLMDEFCNGGSYKNIEASASKTLESVIGDFGDRASDLGPKMKEFPGEFCGPEGVSSSIDSHWPGIAQKKAKLLYMKDEVCRRYKQYHQQMQVILSSFESVAGLASATPYISLGLKTVARHFNCLKNAIVDQLRSISNALGEDLSSPSGTSSSKGDTSGFSINLIHKSFQKQKGQCYTGFPDQAQHLVWRPQRGLPERAVSVLRAWLFDHFLHPYPTDTDKHMLAAQTGLTRNQAADVVRSKRAKSAVLGLQHGSDRTTVSNWFINARVRVWKPMVEEIHMLETKGTKETGSPNASKTDGKSSTECSGSGKVNDVQSFNTRGTNTGSDKQVELSSFSPSECQGDRSREDLHYQEKRSRVEYHIPGNMDGSFTGFLPYHRGAVSLTLGLRQSAESGQQMQAENHLRQHIGGQIVHDFVG